LGQVGGHSDDTQVALVDPPENEPYRSEVRLGRRSWGDPPWSYANGLRFTGVALPRQAPIVSARLMWRYKWHTGLPIHLQLYGEATDWSLPFTESASLAHERPRTQAWALWEIEVDPAAGEWFDVPSLAPLVQEVVNRPGWSPYNPLSILVESGEGTEDYLEIWAYDFDPALAAKLEICYESSEGPLPLATPTATGQPPPVTPTPTPPATPLPVLGSKQGLNWLYHSTVPAQAMADAGAKAVHNWGYDAARANEAMDAGLVYYPVQWHCAQGEASVDEAKIRAFIKANPGRFQGLTWLAFNEPEWWYQAGCTEEQAARAFHELDRVLRRGSNPADPTAKLYCCGLSHSGKFQPFMAEFHAQYNSIYGHSPPIDGVHLHLYNGTTNRLDWCRLTGILDGFRDWQQTQGWLANKAIVLSEWGILGNSTDHPDDIPGMVGNCTPGCTCDTMRIMWSIFEQRPWITHHLWWLTYAPDTGDGSLYWNVGSIFTDRYATQLSDPVGLLYKDLSTPP
jgi:hypothetical protein